MLARLYTRLIEGLATLAGITVAAVCLLIVYDVIARNLGLQPPASTVALTEYALLYFTMAAAPWLVRIRGHIVVELLHSRLSGSVRRVADKLILLVCIATSAFISLLALLLAIEAFTRGEIEIRSMAMPRGWLFVPLAVGFGLMATEFLRLALRGEAVHDPDDRKDAI
ncbi:MAG: TRAP transporter small permease [Gammaproteobacteria bacterium]|nr:TRAP transporter small permease [Gammaproteobacteria bacterium]NND54680.1 TRAP transporter small permease [Gammaproteobacteria bacterium]